MGDTIAFLSARGLTTRRPDRKALEVEKCTYRSHGIEDKRLTYGLLNGTTIFLQKAAVLWSWRGVHMSEDRALGRGIASRNVSAEGFGQDLQCRLVVSGNATPFNEPIAGWPDFAEVNSLVAGKINEFRGAKQVSTKLTDGQRRRLRIAFVGSSFCRWS